MASFHLTVKVGKRGTGCKHADYIQRAGSYKNYCAGEDLVHFEASNMPGWAIHDPSEFFRQADLHERKNGSVYREFEIAIPRELNNLQRIELVRDFVNQEIGKKHPVVWAVHNPSAAISGGEQPHAHIMFSERTLDGIERAPELFFRRANKSSPEEGGCLKSSAFSGGLKSEERRSAIVGLRERFANLQNKFLEENGHESRVTHLSLAAQGIKRQPEIHLGPVASRDHENTVTLIEYRNAQSRAQLHEERASVIDITSRLAAALLEREENGRIRAAAFERIGTNLTTASSYSCISKPDLTGLKRFGGDLEKAVETHQYNRAVGEVTQAIIEQLGGVGEEVTRATEHLAAIIKEHSLLIPREPAKAEKLNHLKSKYSSQGMVREFDHSSNATTIGRIVESTSQYIVTNLGRGHFAIHDRTQFNSIEYNGLAFGDDQFAIGNRATFTYNEHPELRKAMIEEMRPEKLIHHVRGNRIER